MGCYALALTVPQREIAVSRMLHFWRIENYVFRERRKVVCRGRVLERVYTTFPGYVIVKPENSWERVRNASGVLGFLRFGEHVAELDDKKVFELKERADDEGIFPLEITTPVSRFSQGEKVRIGGSGPFFGFDGIFQRMLVDRSAVVDVDWLGRWVPIAVDERDLRALNETPKEKSKKKRRRHNRPKRKHIDHVQTL